MTGRLVRHAEVISRTGGSCRPGNRDRGRIPADVLAQYEADTATDVIPMPDLGEAVPDVAWRPQLNFGRPGWRPTGIGPLNSIC